MMTTMLDVTKEKKREYSFDRNRWVSVGYLLKI